MLWSESAAFGNTKITQLIANRKQEVKQMEEKVLKEVMAGVLASVKKELVESFIAAAGAIETRINDIGVKLDAQKEVIATDAMKALEATNAELKAQIEQLKAQEVAQPKAETVISAPKFEASADSGDIVSRMQSAINARLGK
jgi:predicted component of type VI protein secretion system